MKFAFAGNRDIAVWVLNFIISKGFKPKLLLLTDINQPEAKTMIDLCELPSDKVFFGKPKSDGVIENLKKLDLDYIIGIHYPYIISKELLEVSKYGFLNLHPAYLPYNRGWHTPSWAILEGTPAGATLHFMSEDLDMGDIIHRKQIKIPINETANSIYKKLKELELVVFKETFDDLINFKLTRIVQNSEEGNSHKRKDLFTDGVSKLELGESYQLENLIRKIRALTTNDISEAAFFIKDGKKYRIQVNIEAEK